MHQLFCSVEVWRSGGESTDTAAASSGGSEEQMIHDQPNTMLSSFLFGFSSLSYQIQHSQLFEVSKFCGEKESIASGLHAS